jgi:hypothetical protein
MEHHGRLIALRTPTLPLRGESALRAFDFMIYGTHTSELLRRGTPLKTVSQRLGHATATVTPNMYAYVMAGDDEQAAKVVQKLLRKRLGKNGVTGDK